MKSLLDSRTAWITASAALAVMTIAYQHAGASS